MSLKYQCKKCGTCCHEVPGDYIKRIPIYPDEADNLIEIAKERDIKFKIIEDLVFPDIKNKKITISDKDVREALKGVVEDEDLSRYIL